MTNVVKNYSPHLAPNTLSATAELRKILALAAHEMLVVFLRKSRTRRSVARGTAVGSSGHPIDVVSLLFPRKRCRMVTEYFLKAVDTVLVKLYARFQKTKEILTLLQEPNDVSISEVEPVLMAAGQYNALCLLYKQRADDVKLLESWAK